MGCCSDLPSLSLNVRHTFSQIRSCFILIAAWKAVSYSTEFKKEQTLHSQNVVGIVIYTYTCTYIICNMIRPINTISTKGIYSMADYFMYLEASIKCETSLNLRPGRGEVAVFCDSNFNLYF